MDLTATKRTPLTDTEKQQQRKHRQENGLCRYSGIKGHFIKECPNKKNLTVATNTAATEASTSTDIVLYEAKN